MPAVNWVNNPVETLDGHFEGSITVGQGDIGIDAAAYKFSFNTKVQVPRDGTIDVRVPAGFGYQYHASINSRTTIESGRMSP